MPRVKADQYSFTKDEVANALYNYLAGDPDEKMPHKNIRRNSPLAICVNDLHIRQEKSLEYFDRQMDNDNASQLMQKLLRTYGFDHGRIKGYYRRNNISRSDMRRYVDEYWGGCQNPQVMCRALGLNYEDWLTAVKEAERPRNGNGSGYRNTSRPKTYDEYADIVDADVVPQRSSRNRSYERREKPFREERENPDWERVQRKISRSVSDYQRSRRERQEREAYVDQPEEDTLEYRLSQYFALGIIVLIVLFIAKHFPVIKEATADVHGLIPMIVWAYELTGFYGGILYLIYRFVTHHLSRRTALFDIGMIFFGLGCGGLRDGSFFSGIVLIVIGSALFYASR